MYETLFGDYAAWYTLPAIIGTAFFTLRIILMTIGLGDGGIDLDLHDGAELGAGDPHADSGHDFRILSIQSLAAFAMGFGWGGFAALRGTDWGMTGVNAAALASGAAMVWVLAMLLKGVADLDQSGNVSPASAVGKEGDVYCLVPAGGSAKGQVRVSISGKQRIYDALSDADELPRNARVRVLKVSDDGVLTVTRA